MALRILKIAVVAGLLFASSAAQADRINLWPLAYSDGDEFTLCWPIVTKDANHFAINPLYSYRDGHEHNILWPLASFDTWSGRNHVLPFFWGPNYSTLFPAYLYHRKPHSGNKVFSAALLYWHAFDTSRTYDTLFPLWWYEKRNSGKNKTFWCAAGLAGAKSSDGKIWEHWLLPFWYIDSSTFYTPLWLDDTSSGERVRAVPPLLAAHIDGKDRSGIYSPWYSSYHTNIDNADHGRVLLGAAGWDAAENEKTTLWCAPFFYRDHATFLSPVWMSGEDENSSWTIVPPLLSGKSSSPDAHRWRYLMGLAGADADKDGVSKTWCFPAFYKSREALVTPIYGQTATSRWLFPVWLNTQSTFVSLPWAHHRNERGEIDWAFATPLLSSYSKNDSGEATVRLLGGIAGWSGDTSWAAPLYYSSPETTLVTPLAGKSQDASWILPLYYTDADEFASPLWYRKKSATYTGWLIPPLLMSYESYGDRRKIFTAFPFFSADSNGRFKSIPYSRSAGGDLKKTLAFLDSPTLTDEVRFWAETCTNRAGKVETFQKATRISSHDRRRYIISKDDRSAFGQLCGYGSGSTNYLFSSTRTKGNDLLISSHDRREVKYSAQTREKISEKTHSSLNILAGLLFNSTRDVRKNIAAGTESKSSSQALLIWLWRREESDGNVSVDAFPAFTYDSRPDGYSKTSFFWRLFRRERDAKGNTKLDFLFLPIAR